MGKMGLEVSGEADRWVPPVGERERGRVGGTGPRGPKGKAGRAGKKKERGEEKRGGPWVKLGRVSLVGRLEKRKRRSWARPVGEGVWVCVFLFFSFSSNPF
jgi:hypothetical protein